MNLYSLVFGRRQKVYDKEDPLNVIYLSFQRALKISLAKREGLKSWKQRVEAEVEDSLKK